MSVEKKFIEKILNTNLENKQDKKENKSQDITKKKSFLENNLKEKNCLELINNYFKNYNIGYFNIETFNYFINNELPQIIKSKEIKIEYTKNKIIKIIKIKNIKILKPRKLVDIKIQNREEEVQIDIHKLEYKDYDNLPLLYPNDCRILTGTKITMIMKVKFLET